MNEQPNPPRLVGLTGVSGAGRRTVARMLCSRHGFTELRLADPATDMLQALYALAGIADAWASEPALRKQPTPLGVSHQQLADSLGLQWGPQLRADFWLRVLDLRLAAPYLAGERVVVPDVQLRAEGEYITRRGGLLVRVMRANVPGGIPPGGAYSAALPVSAELHNEGSLATLEDQVDRLAATIESEA